MKSATKSLLLESFSDQELSHPPVWLMRQAGRYLPEYRQMKEKYDFLTLCRNPELACEITMQPMRRFRPDASIIFADIMLPAEALGFQIDFAPGPQVANRVGSAADIAALKPRGVEVVSYVFDAISMVKRELAALAGEDRPFGLLGFAGAPWTMACYLCEQGPFKHFQGTQVFAAEQPQVFAEFLDSVADITIDYLQGQIESGAEVVQLFDSWGGNLALDNYRQIALPPIQKIISALQGKGAPIILYVNGSSHLLPAMLESGADGLGVDWRTDLKAARELVGPSITLQGNFDPTQLFLPEDEIIKRCKTMLASQTAQKRYIANLGHGILQRTPVPHAKAFIDCVQQGWPAA